MSNFQAIRFKRFLFGILLSTIGLQLSGCGYHKLSSEEIDRNRLFAEILKRSDQREIGKDDFFKQQLLGSPHPIVRQWGAIALGRIGNARSLPWLYEAFHSCYAPVRAAAAFAVGEIEDREILRLERRPADARAPAELIRLLGDTSLSVQMRAIEALGKIGGAPEAAAILKRMESIRNDGSPLHQTYLGLSITALMRLGAQNALPVLTRLASEQDPEIQWRVLNALVRMRAKDACRLFQNLLGSANADVQAYAARGLGICEDPVLANQLNPLLGPRDAESGRPRPLKVRISVLQALGSLKDPASAPAIVSSLRGSILDGSHPEDLNFAVQAANALGNIGAASAEDELVRLLSIRGPVADAAVVALARVCKGKAERFFERADRRHFVSAAARRAWAAALAELSGPRAAAELKSMLIAVAGDSSNEAGFYAIPAVLAALARIGDPDLEEILKPYLASRDGVILRAAVEAYLLHAGEKAVPDPIVEAYSRIDSGSDVEAKTLLLDRLQPWISQEAVRKLMRAALNDRLRNVRIAAARMLRMAGESNVPEDPGPSESRAADNTFLLLAGLRKDRSVATIETTRGPIEVELFREDAPLTVANFVALARRGFFDGLTFMRVVPYFVIQGGDPRNDQEGGPGYTIRCEINMRPFERGSLGMALAGKDTGGSQFFITMAPQPHLDGGYTCFGRVISGMDIVDRTVAGDAIKRITIMEDRTSLDFRQF